MDELRAKRAANFEAEIMICTRSVLQIKEYWALNVQTVYMDELRAKRVANFETRNVQNCVKLWYAREACCKLKSIEL